MAPSIVRAIRSFPAWTFRCSGLGGSSSSMSPQITPNSFLPITPASRLAADADWQECEFSHASTFLAAPEEPADRSPITNATPTANGNGFSLTVEVS